MKIDSFNEQIDFNDSRIVTKVILESTFSKEIRILFKKGQLMKEHKAPYPITVHILEGSIDFGVQGETHTMHKGAIIALEGNIPHDLTAKEDSIVRLTLSKLDTVARVNNATNQN